VGSPGAGAYGLSIDDAQNALSTAVGGENISTIVKDSERYPVNVRYLRDSGPIWNR